MKYDIPLLSAFCAVITFDCRFVSDGSVEHQGYEINYIAVECDADEFMCLNSGQCMPGHVLCNNEQDCDDWSDEDYDLCGTSTVYLLDLIQNFN